MDYKELFETSVVGIIKISEDQVIIDANNAFSDFIGIAKNRIIGKNWKQLTPDKWHTKDDEIFNNLKSNGFAEEYEKEFIRANGIVVRATITLWAIFSENEISSFYWGYIKNAVVSAKELPVQNVDNRDFSTERFNGIFNNIPIGICLLNSNAKIINLNNRFLDILQLNEVDVNGKTLIDVFPLNSMSANLFWVDGNKNITYIDEVKKRKKNISFNRENKKKYLKLEYIPITNNRSGEDEFLLVVDDTTDLFELEKKFRHSQKMDSIGALTGGIAHDFNNILTGILGYAELLKWNISKDSQNYEEIVGIINASNRAKDLIHQLLTFSRQQETKPVVVNITTVLKEIIRLLRGSLPSNIEIYNEYPSDTWNTMADPSQIHQVIMNLCINAQHAMPEGGTLKILIQNIELDEEFCKRNLEAVPGKHVCLTVEDTGIGMDEEVKSRIFEPFFTTKSAGQGTGLGLAIVYGIVKGMQGFIDVESELGKGTTFKVYCPAVMAESSSDFDIDDNLKGGNELILFVDDEVPIVEIATSIFKNFGYRTLKAHNGVEALEIYKQNMDKIDIVITDLTMPKMSGTHLAREILALNKNAKIILCSGFASSQIINSLRDIGVKEFVQKPLVASLVLNTLRKVLDEK
jgi:PAS domain S-box-containing protein